MSWKPANQKPREYDICLLDVGDKKNIIGWWTGLAWDGLRYDGQQVYQWKRIVRR